MSLEVIIEDLIVERRAALLADGEAIEIKLMRGDQGPQPGALYAARVVSATGASSAVVDLGADGEALLQWRRSKKRPVEGELVAVEVKRASLAEAGDDKRPIVRRADVPPGDVPGPIRAAPDPLADWLGLEPDRVVVDHPALKAALKDRYAGEIIVARDAFRARALDETLEAIAAGRIALGGGAFFTIEETDALVAVDVNAPPGIDATEVNRRAAEEIARQLRLQNIGGLVVIDFLDLKTTEARAALLRLFDRAVASDPVRIDRGKVDKFSTLTLTRARRGPSLGRQLARRVAAPTREAAAAALFERALSASNASGPGRLALRMTPRTATYIGEHPEWSEKLQRRTGREISPGAAEKDDAYVTTDRA